MCGKVLQGIEVDPEHLALDVIEAVGPGGSFILSDHTLAHLRSEYYLGNHITDQQNRERWEKDGSPDARARGRQIVKKILAEEEKSYILPDVDQAIRAKYNILLP
jgi:trimethylamine--corrinoid protein Co-methyltransferase